MGLLSGDGASILTNIFNRIYVSGAVGTTVTTYSDVGEPTPVVTYAPARVQVDNMTEAMRGAEGASDTDRRILVLATAGISVDTDAVLLVNEGPYAGSYWLVMAVTRDPCGAVFDCRARRRPD